MLLAAGGATRQNIARIVALVEQDTMAGKGLAQDISKQDQWEVRACLSGSAREDRGAAREHLGEPCIPRDCRLLAFLRKAML